MKPENSPGDGDVGKVRPAIQSHRVDGMLLDAPGFRIGRPLLRFNGMAIGIQRQRVRNMNIACLNGEMELLAGLRLGINGLMD